MQRSYGYGWRSSRVFTLATACVALLTETLLYGFVVPILPHMLEVRLGQDPAQTQNSMTGLLSIHGFVTLVSAPVIASFTDKTANRKIPLLLSLVSCLTGTILVASTVNLGALYAGRVLQAIAGSAAWIVCLAILTENAGEGNIGKMMGLSMSFVMVGTVGGPMIAGAVLELQGYWAAWSIPLVVLFFNIIARLIMIDPEHKDSSERFTQNEESPNNATRTETSPLLQSATTPKACHTQATSSSHFYKVMLRDSRIWASLASSITYPILLSGFNATLPIHLREVFNWGSLPLGMVLFLLQLPTIFLGPLSGWLRDHVGLRYPTTIGWALLAPFVCLLGFPGDTHFPWASASNNGKPIFISCMAAIGIVLPLVQGAGFLHTLTVLQDVEARTPTIFGPLGGRSKAFAMNSVGINTGFMIGPLITGFLSQSIGYLYTNVILGRSRDWDSCRSFLLT
ncbi:MFS general substrate transporter, partial [Penicillium nucicola]|uniref:MFS general substrate transporter n=1 Tax=Penicillium nucicola TaxID=1850975 RepID=UPI002544E435